METWTPKGEKTKSLYGIHKGKEEQALSISGMGIMNDFNFVMATILIVVLVLSSVSAYANWLQDEKTLDNDQTLAIQILNIKDKMNEMADDINSYNEKEHENLAKLCSLHPDCEMKP